VGRQAEGAPVAAGCRLLVAGLGVHVGLGLDHLEHRGHTAQVRRGPAGQQRDEVLVGEGGHDPRADPEQRLVRLVEHGQRLAGVAAEGFLDDHRKRPCGLLDLPHQVVALEHGRPRPEPVRCVSSSAVPDRRGRP